MDAVRGTYNYRNDKHGSGFVALAFIVPSLVLIDFSAIREGTNPLASPLLFANVVGLTLLTIFGSYVLIFLNERVELDGERLRYYGKSGKLLCDVPYADITGYQEVPYNTYEIQTRDCSFKVSQYMKGQEQLMEQIGLILRTNTPTFQAPAPTN